MPQPAASPQQPAVVTIVDHPLVRHKLSLMRDRATSSSKFRQLMREISLLLGYEATRNLALEEIDIETPLERTRAPLLAGKKLCLVSILRAKRRQDLHLFPITVWVRSIPLFAH